MEWRPDPPGTGPVIAATGASGYRLADGSAHAALLLTPEAALPWSPPAPDALTVAELAPLLELSPRPEFLLLGTGLRASYPPAALRADLDARGIGIEVMDGRAAARAWRVLRSEQRWIAAALWPFAPLPSG